MEGDPQFVKTIVTLASIIGAFAVSLALNMAFGWRWYWAWWTGFSLVAFLLYGFDKVQAKREGSRVPEFVLHLLALAGGVAGAWLGRCLFRHKTRHTLFTVFLVLATVLHVALWWFVLRNA